MPATQERFRSTVAHGLSKTDAGVDRNRNAIFGASIIQLGEVNDDRPWIVDNETLAQVVQFGNQPNNGLKARFTHPNMSDDGLGKHLGRWKGFRVQGDTVRADLFIADSAFNTPDGNLGEYVLSLAEEDPEAFGVSVASVLDMEVFDDDGEMTEQPLRFSALHAADVVDEPAATRSGMFSVGSLSSKSPDFVATWILDNHFSNSEPEELLERFRKFLTRYFGRTPMSETTKDDVVLDTQPVTEQPIGIDPGELSKYLEEFGDIGGRWLSEGKSFDDCRQQQVADLRQENTQLKADKLDLETRLEAALASVGETAPLDTGDDKDAKGDGSLSSKINIK